MPMDKNTLIRVTLLEAFLKRMLYFGNGAKGQNTPSTVASSHHVSSNDVVKHHWRTKHLI